MPDGDNLILGQNNNAQSQTNLTTGLGDESGSYGLRVTALDGNAVGGLSALGFGIEGVKRLRTRRRGHQHERRGSGWPQLQRVRRGWQQHQ
jgi:hypothetical protein